MNAKRKLCEKLYENYTLDGAYCNAVFDEILCWPPTEAGKNATLSCPNFRGLNPNKFAYRFCNLNGSWDNNNRSKMDGFGYTHFETCYQQPLQELMNMINNIGANKCFEIIEITRIIEIIGLTLSLISLILSLFIFYHYRILKNNRTKIHKNLFIATLMQVNIRLIIYMDHGFDGNMIGSHESLCKLSIVLLEYTKSAMFMWILIEGVYLHNVIAIAVFQDSFLKFYSIIAWSFPMLLTPIWIVTMLYNVESTEKCWYLYNLLPYYWILEGPRYAIIVINIFFLLNVIRVLVLKLRESKKSEIVQVRKAVRAAIVLLPLMGTANILFIMNFKLFKKAWEFALWSYTSYFLSTFQGFFIALIYCFGNGEVRTALRNSFNVYKHLRYRKDHPQRNSVADTGLFTFESER